MCQERHGKKKGTAPSGADLEDLSFGSERNMSYQRLGDGKQSVCSERKKQMP